MNEHSRVSDMSISDDVIRAELYKRIFNYLDNKANIGNISIYTIKEDEKQRPDLVAHRHYGTHDLAWAVSLVSGLDDPCEDLPVGFEIELPPQSVIRTMIREVKEFVDVTA